MGTRGRQSVAALGVVAISGQRIEPPDHLTPDQAAEWRSIVDSLPADYFRPGDVSLLSAYVTASVFYRRASADMEARGMTLMDERGREYVNPSHSVLTSQASAMAQMAVKLRLCPSSRYTEQAAATKTSRGSTRAKPWEAAG